MLLHRVCNHFISMKIWLGLCAALVILRNKATHIAFTISFMKKFRFHLNIIWNSSVHEHLHEYSSFDVHDVSVCLCLDCDVSKIKKRIPRLGVGGIWVRLGITFWFHLSTGGKLATAIEFNAILQYANFIVSVNRIDLDNRKISIFFLWNQISNVQTCLDWNPWLEFYF